MTQTSVTEPTTTLQDLYGDQFTMAVRQAAAIMDKPEYNGRLQMAMDFVLSGSVTLHEDGTATVKSGSHTYEIAPECTCQDSQQRSLYCKHYLAVQLLKRTYERLHVRQGNGTAPQAGATPQPWECAQAPSSCTLKWAVNGIELMLTLRAADDQALFNRIGRVLPRIEAKMEAQRQEREAKRQAQAGSNAQPPATPQSAAGDEQWCEYHQVPLKQYSKDGRTWHSHFDNDTQTWCRGR